MPSFERVRGILSFKKNIKMLMKFSSFEKHLNNLVKFLCIFFCLVTYHLFMPGAMNSSSIASKYVIFLRYPPGLLPNLGSDRFKATSKLLKTD